jgi:hypothetical protein
MLTELNGLRCSGSLVCDIFKQSNEATRYIRIFLRLEYNHYLLRTDGSYNENNYIDMEHIFTEVRINADNEKDVIIDNIKQLLFKYYTTIDDLKFDKFSSQLVLNKKNRHLNLTKKLKNVKHIFEDCCVCYEPTMSKTCCGHFVCRMCISNMTSTVVDDVDDDEEPDKVACPMCREDIASI